MSNSPLNAQHSQPQNPLSPSPSNPPDLATLAEKLQEATQALLAFCRAGSLEQTDTVDEEIDPDDSAMSDEDEGVDDQGETRIYYFSPFTLRNERALLEEYETEDFRGLLFEAHVSLMGLVALMKNIEQEVSMNSYVVYSLGCLLERASSLIFQMQDAYSTVEQVES